MQSPSLAANDLSVKDQTEEMEIDSNADRAASPGTLTQVTCVTAQPALFAFAALPAFASPTSAPTSIVYNNISSPFDKPWDLSLKADQACWIAATKANKDHKRFDISVATAHDFIKLVQDKSKFYR